MNRFLVPFLVCFLFLIPGVSIGSDEPAPPPDPFAELIAATSALADLAVALKPTADNVTAKGEAVARKEAELREATDAHETAKLDFNEALAGFVAAIDKLKEAALKIPTAGGGDPGE
jgi:hypothetical protein